MKFKDVKTLESILLEYGMKPGSSTSVSQQQSGASAKANAKPNTPKTPKSPTTSNTPKKPDQGSPTLGQEIEPQQPPQPVAKKASELELDTEYKNDKGDVVGKVVSKIGDKPQPDKVVVQDPKGEYQLVEPDDEVFVDAELEEGKIQKRIRKKALNKLKPKVKAEKRKVKQLAKLSLKEAPEKLFEINFNRKEIINSSLDAQIRCGWEAETVWENIEGTSDDVDNLTLSEIDDQYGGVDWDSISENYTDWIYENKQEEFLDDLIDDFVNEREDDEDYINEFIDDENIEESDWADYREGVLRTEYGDERYEEEGAEELSELYGYEDENWAREYVDEYRGSDFRDFLRDIAADDEDIKQAAYEEASENYDYDDYINDNYYSMSSFCDDYGIDYSYGNNLGEVAELVSKFVRQFSAFSDDYVESGDYGNTSGSTVQYAVESDSSIDGYGTGAEIISPVFSTPRRMLAEMKKFFEFLQSEGALTNNSTGLHITMSYNPQDGETVNHKPGTSEVIANRVKMAVLLGDQYLLNEFLRGSNTYTKSQYKELQNAISELKQESGTEGIKKAEAFLEKAISDDKFRAIHFKRQKDSNTNTNLIEFRISGGEDYEQDFDKVFKATVRYATTMIAGHTDQYEGDYAKALSKLLRKANDVSQGDVEEVDELKGRFEDVASDPVLDTSKAIISSKKYLEFTKLMLDGMETLKKARLNSEPEADVKWKKQWMKYLKNTSDNLEDFDSSLKRALDKIKYSKKGGLKEVKSGGSIKAYFRPSMNPPSKEVGEMRQQGIKDVSEALGMLAVDVANGIARQQPNAKSIGALRSFLKKENISDKQLDSNIKLVLDDLRMDASLNIQNRIELVRDGINQLLSREVITRPDFVTAPQVESAIKGMWNVMNSKEFNPTVLKEITTLGIDVRVGKDSQANKKEIIEDLTRLFKDASDKRQFNDFYNHLTTAGYNSRPYFLQPGMIYNKQGFNDFIKFVKQFDSYSEPVNRNHNPNIYDDDSYEDVALSKYTMLLRRRFDFLDQQYASDKSKAVKSMQQMVPFIEGFFKNNKSDEGSFEDILGIDKEEVKDLPSMSDEDKENFMDLLGERDGERYLGVSNYKYENVQNTLDDIIKDTTSSRTVHHLQDVVTDSIRESLGSYYRNKERYPEYYKFDEIKNLIKSRFEGLANFMRSIDNIFVDNGFASQDSSIKRKQQLTKDRDNFKKTVRNSSYATINIPAHSLTYMKKDDYDRIMEWIDEYGDGDEQPNRTLLQDVVDGATKVNKGSRPGMFFVVPAAHWGPLTDAVSGSEILQIYQRVGNMSQNWRAVNYGKLFEKFASLYGIDYKTLDNKDKYVQLDGQDRRKISKSFRIEFTGKLDGRAGMGDVEELIPSQELKNQSSGEPLDRSSAASWNIQNDDKLAAAYDWQKYHGKEADAIKKKVMDLVKNKDMGFYRAIQTVMEQTPKGIRVIEDKRIIDAGGVEHMEGEASNTIQGSANWSNLADFFKIERGVDNQGPNILEKTSRTFDGDHEWRPEPEPDAVGMKRWVASVKAAAEYIKLNYTVSGGNYFRKNPDGSLGDDVGELYGDGGRAMPDGARARMARGEVTRGRDSEVTEQDYEDMRSKYQGFDTMMVAGIQRFIMQPDVNRLVAFLKNPDNDENFKKTVLQVLVRDHQEGEEANDFQGALARGRQELQGGANESVFARFDALPLQEQLAIISESKVLERPLTKDEKQDKEKYVKGMKKSKKDFEKRYGKDAKAVMYATATKMAKEDLKKLPKKSIYEIHSAKEYDNTDDDGFIKFRYGDASGGDEKLASISGLPENEVYDNGVSRHIFLMDNKEPIFLLTIKRGLDGWVTTNVVTHSKHRGKGFAVPVYLAISKAYGDPLYSFGTQSPGGHKIWQNLAKKYPKRVTGYNVVSKEEVPFSDVFDGKVATRAKLLPETKLNEEGVPKVNTVKILNDLLADHFPVSDLKKQMLAFQAIPIPQMLNQFRELRAEAGDDACARGIVRYYVNALPKSQQDQIDLNEWAKSKVRSLIESKGIMGRVLGDTFLKGDDRLEFQSVNLYPSDEMEFDSPEQRDDFVQQLEQELNSQIEWTNVPNKGSLAFGVAVLTDPALDDKITYWGRYFKQKTADMMGKWGNNQVPQGWKLQTAGAMKLDIGIDPQHLIKTDDAFNGVIDVIQAVKTNSAGNELSESLVNALETIHTQEHPTFPGQISNLPALRDYFGEIMGPVALMSDMVGGQAEDARRDLLRGIPWANCTIFWPMAMNAPLVDSYFTAPDGTRVGISSKGGKGAKASVKNIQDAILKAPEELKAQYPVTVNVINIVQSNSAKDGPFRLAELYKILPQGLEEEINGYIQEGKQDYAGLSPACTELFNYGTPRQDVPGFNTGYAMLALLAKKVTRAINDSGPEFGQGCVAFLNQSSIVQLYCKMGKQGDDARVTGWEAVYPPNFQGTVEIDGSKNYYSSRIGGKFAFGFK